MGWINSYYGSTASPSTYATVDGLLSLALDGESELLRVRATVDGCNQSL